MNYEEKYKEDLESAKGWLAIAKENNNNLSIQMLEKLFPELKESEDERMVKFIKNQLFNIKKTITENYELDAKLTKAIDWLEKQGEQKVINEYNEHEPTSYEKGYDIGYMNGKNEQRPTDAIAEMKQVEWSEEDKSMYIRTLGILGKCYMGELPTEVEEELKWFKSITDKAQPQTNQYDKGYEDGYSAAKYNQWKPSEEQMYILEWLTTNVLDDGVVGKKVKEVLNTLIEQLKSL